MRTIFLRTPSKVIIEFLLFISLFVISIHKLSNNIDKMIYVESPWYEYMDKKLFRFSSAEPVKRPTIDVSYLFIYFFNLPINLQFF